MNTLPAPVRISDKEMIKTMRYLNLNLEQIEQNFYYRPQRNFSEVKNYFKRNFDWSHEYFENRTKRLGLIKLN